LFDDALSLHPLCEGSLGEMVAGGVGAAGEMRREKREKFFSKRLPEPKECLPLQPGSAEPVFLGKD